MQIIVITEFPHHYLLSNFLKKKLYIYLFMVTSYSMQDPSSLTRIRT